MFKVNYAGLYIIRIPENTSAHMASTQEQGIFSWLSYVHACPPIKGLHGLAQNLATESHMVHKYTPSLFVCVCEVCLRAKEEMWTDGGVHPVHKLKPNALN